MLNKFKYSFLKQASKPVWWAFYLLVFISIIAIIAPIIATPKPYCILINKQWYFPFFTNKKVYIIADNAVNIEQVNWKTIAHTFALYSPVPYSPNESDYMNANYISPTDHQLFKNENGSIEPMPLKFRHWLGTNKRGEDVLSGLIHGTTISIFIGISAMCIATIIGLFMGLVAGYFGNNTFEVSKPIFITMLCSLLPAWFYSYQLVNCVILIHYPIDSVLLQLCLIVVLFLLFTFFIYLMSKYIFKKNITTIILPLDTMISKLIEVIISLPLLIIITTLAAITKPSIFNIVCLIGFLHWTTIARIIRAESKKVVSLDYIQFSRLSGATDFYILTKHVLPNVIAPSLIAIVFGIGGAIITESSLSFLGIGVPAETVTWGSLIFSSKENFSAWWLAIFPGLSLFITLLSYNILGDALRDYLDKKSQ